MFKYFIYVASVWHIIIGGWIIFIDGDRWCIACRGTVISLMGVISILLGVIGIVGGLRNSDPMPGRG